MFSLSALAARAKAGKATVYRRWASKEDLAVAAMESLYEAELPAPDTGSIVEDLRESYRAVLAFVNSPEGEGFLRVSIAESVRDERIALLYRQSILRREEQARDAFARGIARGEVRPDADIDYTFAQVLVKENHLAAARVAGTAGSMAEVVERVRAVVGVGERDGARDAVGRRVERGDAHGWHRSQFI